MSFSWMNSAWVILMVPFMVRSCKQLGIAPSYSLQSIQYRVHLGLDLKKSLFSLAVLSCVSSCQFLCEESTLGFLSNIYPSRVGCRIWLLVFSSLRLGAGYV